MKPRCSQEVPSNTIHRMYVVPRRAPRPQCWIIAGWYRITRVLKWYAGTAISNDV
jgi:hypothetical protein